MPFNPVANSTFLDAYGANLSTAAQYAAIAAGSSSPLIQLFQSPGATATIASAGFNVTVGLVLDRAADPTSLLAGNWAQREAALAAFPNSAALWSQYGANPGAYAAVQAAVTTLLGTAGPQQTASGLGYVSSAADRTIWLSLTPTQFQTLFGQALQQLTYTTLNGPITLPFWTGNLGLDSSIPVAAVKGLWVESGVSIPNPAVLDSKLVEPVPLVPVRPVTDQSGALGIGNGVNTTGQTGHVIATPAAIAANYKFPLPAGVATAPIALVETDIANQANLFADYNFYRQQVGLPTVTPAQFQVLSGPNSPTGNIIDEVTLDISVVAGALPNSTQLIYSHLDSNGGTPFNAYQQAFFDFVRDPAVLTSSYPQLGQPTANSPFQWAWQQLFVDGALSNVSVHMAGGDQGSSAAIANGAANVINSHSSPFTLIVGGTSIASLYSARHDQTLKEMEKLARLDDPATVFPLVAAGLRTLPSHLSPEQPSPAGQSAVLQQLFETVWQGLSLTPITLGTQEALASEFGKNQTGSGGLASTTIPSYQAAYGLSKSTGGLRGTPDVAAIATGDTGYAALDSDYVNGTANTLIHGDGGTSSAAPLWASLTTQINTIFNDQGLPNLGFYNDILYQAAVIAPGAFGDVQLGNDVNSFYLVDKPTDYYNSFLGTYMIPTGRGYSATPGYDLTSGLGTPNGTLLARSLTWIAHDQVSFPGIPDVIDQKFGGWVSGANQSLLIQASAVPGVGAQVGLNIGGTITSFASPGSAAFAWTSRLAEQSLQRDFDDGLAILFDKQSQGTVMQMQVGDGQSLSVAIDGHAALATQATLSSSLGFADFFLGGDTLRVARPVMVAETVGGQNDQLAVVRLRQVDTDQLALTFYRVDDFSGSIGGLQPGSAGYQAALLARAYTLSTGGTSLDGPGYGKYAESMLRHVNAGDLIAMQLTDKTTGNIYSAFSQANETVNGRNVAHIYNYGANTWGWESGFGGGDGDYNDLVVQIDPTSAYNHAWLV